MSPDSLHVEGGPATGPPQFGLRSLLVGITLLSMLFAMCAAVGAAWSVALVLLLCLVGAHVLGNALGTRLREGDHLPADGVEFSTAVQNSTVAAPARLQENTPIRRPWLVAGAVCGLLSGSLGGVVLATTDQGHLTVAGLALGIASSALVGGLLGFLACSAWMVGRTALAEALQEGDPASPPTEDGPQ